MSVKPGDKYIFNNTITTLFDNPDLCADSRIESIGKDEADQLKKKYKDIIQRDFVKSLDAVNKDLELLKGLSTTDTVNNILLHEDKKHNLIGVMLFIGDQLIDFTKIRNDVSITLPLHITKETMNEKPLKNYIY